MTGAETLKAAEKRNAKYENLVVGRQMMVIAAIVVAFVIGQAAYNALGDWTQDNTYMGRMLAGKPITPGAFRESGGGVLPGDQPGAVVTSVPSATPVPTRPSVAMPSPVNESVKDSPGFVSKCPEPWNCGSPVAPPVVPLVPIDEPK